MARSLQVDLQLNIDNAKRQLNQLSQEAQKAFRSGGSSSQSYQQAAQQAAQQQVIYRNALSQQAAFNRSLQEEARLRQQAFQAAQRQQQQHQQYLRQQFTPAAQTLASAVPGGNIVGAGLGLGGTAALAGAAAVAAAVAAVGNEFNKLGDRARELAASSGTASSQLGQLRSSIEKAGISRDIAATSPGVVGFQKFISEVGTNLSDAFANLSKKGDRDKALQEKFSDGLGQGNEDWRRLQQQGMDMVQDQGIARQALAVKYQRQERDFNLEQRKFQVDTANQIFDLNKQAQRQQQDYSIQKQKYDENQAGVMAAKQFAISQYYAKQAYQISQSRAQTDYTISRSDKTVDFTIDKSRSTEEFNINKSRQGEDFQETKLKMALGGASGQDYLFANMDYLKQQAREQADFTRSQRNATQDFTLSNSRDARGFALSQSRAGQDFSISQQQAQVGHQMELENMLYARKYESLGLEIQHARALQDINTQAQRLAQNIGFQQTGFANQRADMAQDKGLDYSNFALQVSRQNRDYSNALADFAGSARAKDPLGAAGLGSRDAAFAQALAANARQSGQTDLFSQINGQARNRDTSLGGQVGTVISNGSFNPFENGNVKAMVDASGPISSWLGKEVVKDLINFHPFGMNLFGDPNQGKGNQGQPNQTNIYLGDRTLSLPSGFDANFQNKIEDIIAKGDQNVIREITDLINSMYNR